MTKVICKECGWVGTSDELLKAPNPFSVLEDIYGCPQCLTPNSVTELDTVDNLVKKNKEE